MLVPDALQVAVDGRRILTAKDDEVESAGCRFSSINFGLSFDFFPKRAWFMYEMPQRDLFGQD